MKQIRAVSGGVNEESTAPYRIPNIARPRSRSRRGRGFRRERSITPTRRRRRRRSRRSTLAAASGASSSPLSEDSLVLTLPATTTTDTLLSSMTHTTARAMGIHAAFGMAGLTTVTTGHGPGTDITRRGCGARHGGRERNGRSHSGSIQQLLLGVKTKAGENRSVGVTGRAASNAICDVVANSGKLVRQTIKHDDQAEGLLGRQPHSVNTIYGLLNLHTSGRQALGPPVTDLHELLDKVDLGDRAQLHMTSAKIVPGGRSVTACSHEERAAPRRSTSDGERRRYSHYLHPK
jgi:hypothetical protein